MGCCQTLHNHANINLNTTHLSSAAADNVEKKKKNMEKGSWGKTAPVNESQLLSWAVTRNPVYLARYAVK